MRMGVNDGGRTTRNTTKKPMKGNYATSYASISASQKRCAGGFQPGMGSTLQERARYQARALYMRLWYDEAPWRSIGSVVIIPYRYAPTNQSHNVRPSMESLDHNQSHARVSFPTHRARMQPSQPPPPALTRTKSPHSTVPNSQPAFRKKPAAFQRITLWKMDKREV